MKSKTKNGKKRKKTDLSSADLAGVSGGRVVVDSGAFKTLGKALLTTAFKAARRGR